MNKLIFISNSLADIEQIKVFAKKHKYQVEHYSKEEWRGKMRRPKKSKSRRIRHLSVVPERFTRPPLSSPTMNEVKEKAINDTLIRNRGKVYVAAKALGISRATLYRKVQELGIDLESIRFLAEEEESPVALKKAS